MNDRRLMDRREFLRAAIGLGLVGGVGVLVFREQNAEADCVKRITCDRCQVFGSCELPKAKKAQEISAVPIKANPRQS